jgi:hypothetical protein
MFTLILFGHVHSTGYTLDDIEALLPFLPTAHAIVYDPTRRLYA